MNLIEGSTALVTGANRGIGKAFVAELLAAGAAKVYATARDTGSLADLQDARVETVELDVTRPDTIARAVQIASDVSLLVNNAGISAFERLVGARGADAARQEMEVNFFGVLNMTRAFAPVLAANGGGAVITVSSIAGLVNFPDLGSYSASKAAVHSLIQGTRAELAGQRTQVFGVYPGPVDTDMGAKLDMAKASPREVVRAVFEGMEAGVEDIFPDATSAELHKGLKADAKGLEKHLAGTMAA